MHLRRRRAPEQAVADPAHEARCALLAAAPEGLLVVDADQRVIEVNDRFLRLTGLTREAVVGAVPPYPWWLPELHDTCAAVLDRILTTDDGEFQSEIRGPEERRTPVEGRWGPFADADGRTGRIISLRDVSARRLVEDRLRESEQRLRALFGSMGDGVVVQDVEGRVVLANPAAARILGLTLDELLGGGAWNARPATAQPRRTWHLTDTSPAMIALATGKPQRDVVVGVVNAEDRHRWLRVNSDPLDGATGVPSAVISTFVDITEREVRERETQALHGIARVVAEGAAPSVVFESVTRELATIVNADLAVVVRFDGDTGVFEGYFRRGDRPDTSPPLQPIDLTVEDNSVSAVWATHAPAVHHDLRQGAAGVLGLGRVPRPQMTQAVPVKVGGEVWGVLSVGTIDAPLAEGTLERMLRFADLASIAIASTLNCSHVPRDGADALTGLCNRQEFTRHLGRLDTDEPTSVICIDLDRFKHVNDLCGLSAGNRALQAVGTTMRSMERDGDLVARLGGDRFALLLHDAPIDEARTEAERLVRMIRAIDCDLDLTLTASAGVVALTPGEAPADLLRRADDALSLAKGLGGDRVSEAPQPVATP